MCAFEPPASAPAGLANRVSTATGTCQPFNAVFDSLREGGAIAETHGTPGENPSLQIKITGGREARRVCAVAAS